ncbi:MAG: hypothetical protein P8N31_06715 [Planctomycetota bacterium]|jgi:hypothetical protein|nr:hypothetical protein [Planctomycetota bacterium]MDG2143228.1 hypothetical protein [Planctomycetota bacterium]
MADGISRITTGKAISSPDRVTPKKDREREEQLDFAEEMEHRSHGNDSASKEPDDQKHAHGISHGGTRPVGYRTDEEAGGGLDLTA